MIEKNYTIPSKPGLYVRMGKGAKEPRKCKCGADTQSRKHALCAQCQVGHPNNTRGRLDTATPEGALINGKPYARPGGTPRGVEECPSRAKAVEDVLDRLANRSQVQRSAPTFRTVLRADYRFWVQRSDGMFIAGPFPFLKVAQERAAALSADQKAQGQQ